MANDFDVLFQGASEPEETPPKPASLTAATSADKSATQSTKQPVAKTKRGRPATGKRSDDGWISRAFYVQETTDIDLEAEINQLRREGIKMDKSDLVNSCLVAWLKWRKGEQPSKCLSEISSRRKGE